ncbi:hypothetical protein ACFQS2_15075 [Brachybacterium sp. GCM10030267]|uniref:hypothetical protein n=1 Tax=Brachybacterium sp. GCM10030267 TaxID=3273381 RepID=UPI0036093E39
MNIFCGCDPETLDELAEKLVESAKRIIELIELLRTTSVTVAWAGPDADSHRGQVDAVAVTAGDVCAAIRDRAEMLREESAQQVSASEARSDRSDPLRWARAEMPAGPGGGSGGSGGNGGSGRGLPFPELFPRLSPPPWYEGLGPTIGGPFQAEDPFELVPVLGAPLPPVVTGGPGSWSPIGGPMAREPEQLRTSRDSLPEGEEFDLAPERLERAEEVRRGAFKMTKWSAGAQALMDLHSTVGDGLDLAESTLEDNGLGAFTPAVSLARIPHEISGVAVGENSVMGQVTGGVEHLVANADQTTREVADAIGDGDPAAAARAGERGMYRHFAGVAGIVTATPVPALTDAVDSSIGHAADIIEPVSPEAASRIREGQDAGRETLEPASQAWDEATDAETWYDLRRAVAPLPWDPQPQPAG